LGGEGLYHRFKGAMAKNSSSQEVKYPYLQLTISLKYQIFKIAWDLHQYLIIVKNKF